MLHPSEELCVAGLMASLIHDVPQLAGVITDDNCEFSFWKDGDDNKMIIIRKTEGRSWSLYLWENDAEKLLEHYETAIDMFFAPANVYQLIRGQLL